MKCPVQLMGARPDDLRRLAAVLAGAVDEVAWLRRRVEAAQLAAGTAPVRTDRLGRLEAWLDTNAVDLRRRALRLEEAGRRGGPTYDFHPPGISAGGCGSVVVPLQARRREPDGTDAALGEPLFASAALQCAPPLRWSRQDALALVVTPAGTVLLARRGGGGAAGGSGTPPPSKKGRLKKARLPVEGPFHFRPKAGWDPRNPIKWNKEKMGYVDDSGNVWCKGPSRTPGQPFEWDVQLAPGSSWRRFSKDGKHINVTLDGRLSH